MLSLAACSSQPVRDAGEGLRIVSLNPCSDAILAEIAPEALVALSHYSQSSASTSMPLDLARKFPATSGTAEEIAALRPDVVIASPFLAPATAQALDRLGIRIERIGIAASVAESAAQVSTLATLAGKEEAGEALVAAMQSAPEVADDERPTALLWQTGGIVAGNDTLVAQMLDLAGFANHAAIRGLGQGAYLPLERVLADPPDVVIAAGGERALAHPSLRALKGVHYATLDPALLYCGGPTVPKLARRLAEIREAVP